MGKYFCLCCGYKTLEEEPPGTYYICEICDWEDDTCDGGANQVSLKQAKRNFEKYGVSDLKHIKHVRKVTMLDERYPNWKSLYYPS